MKASHKRNLGQEILDGIKEIKDCQKDNKKKLKTTTILDYKIKIDKPRLKALQKLSEQAQKLKMGY